MNDDKIAEIRARHQRIETTDDDALLCNLEFSWANADRGWLLAEVERLTRERDESKSKETDYREGFEEGWDAAQRGAADEIEKLTRERDEARAEVERLRGALREAALMSDCCAWCRAEVADFCRKALKAKP